MNNIVVLECPQCGAGVRKGSNICESCFSEYMVTSFSNVERMNNVQVNKYLSAYKKSVKDNDDNEELHFSMGICYLKLKLYDYAIKSFEKAINCMPENADVYYYAAISLFKGKRPFLTLLSNVKKAIEYVEAALSLSEEGRYYYLMYVIQKDFFDKKRLKNNYNSDELLINSQEKNITQDEIDSLFELISIP